MWYDIWYMIYDMIWYDPIRYDMLYGIWYKIYYISYVIYHYILYHITHHIIPKNGAPNGKNISESLQILWKLYFVSLCESPPTHLPGAKTEITETLCWVQSPRFESEESRRTSKHATLLFSIVILHLNLTGRKIINRVLHAKLSNKYWIAVMTEGNIFVHNVQQ